MVVLLNCTITYFSAIMLDCLKHWPVAFVVSADCTCWYSTLCPLQSFAWKNLESNVVSALKMVGLAVGLFLAIPLLFVYRQWLRTSSLFSQHLYFAVTGIATGCLALGIQSVSHHLFCIFVNYSVLRVFRGNVYSTAFLFTFQLGYYFFGYMLNATGNEWNTHCVLVSRLIGHAMDTYDGTKHKDQLSKGQLALRLEHPPSLIETLSHCFFVGSYFVGPQHSFAIFKGSLERNQRCGDLTGSSGLALKLFFQGVGFATINIVTNEYFPLTYIMSTEFREKSLIMARLIAYVSSYGASAKITAAFLLSESACVLAGMTFNGIDATGAIDWSGWKNMDLKRHYFSTSPVECIKGNNLTTNKWSSLYVFKRLRFLGNKALSKCLTMLFFAVWHGPFFGFFWYFGYVLAGMFVEEDIKDLVAKSSILKSWCPNKKDSYLIRTAGFLATHFVITLDGLPMFLLYTFDNFCDAMAGIWPIGVILLLMWFILRLPIRWLLIDQ